MEPVTKQVVVEAPAERAFRVFTTKFGLWWPREHHIGAADLKDAVIEPKEFVPLLEQINEGESHPAVREQASRLLLRIRPDR